MKHLLIFLLLTGSCCYGQFARTAAFVGMADYRVTFRSEEGAALGSDIATNGSFNFTNGWTLAAGVTIDTNLGIAQWNGTAFLRQNVTMLNNAFYEFVMQLTNFNNSTANGSIRAQGWTATGPEQYGDGVIREIVYLGPSDAVSAFFLTGSTLTQACESVTVKHITPKMVNYRPRKVAITGDSIAQQNTLMYPGYYPARTTKKGEMLSRAIITPLDYALGNTDYIWAVTNGVPRACGSGAQSVIIHCGVNDLNNGRTWTMIETNLADIRTIVTTQDLFFSEMIPWINGSDAQALTLRTWNTNLSLWCATNNATFITGHHDAVATNRASTGFLDNVRAGYNTDGVHLNQGGRYLVWDFWLAALETKYGVPVR